MNVLNTWVKEYVENWLIKFYQAQIVAVCGSRNLSLKDPDISQTIDTIIHKSLQTLTNCKKGE
jgi:hypothetical protein